MKLGRTRKGRRQGGWVAIYFAVEAVVWWLIDVGIGAILQVGFLVYSVRANQVANHRARREAASLALNVESRMRMVRQAITSWRVIYGTVRVSGVITFFHSTNNAKTLHILLTLAGHEVEAIDDIYFDDEYIPLGASGGAITGRWAGYVTIKKGLGSIGGDSDLMAWMVANTGGVWTTNHKQTGHAKLYIQFTANNDLFATGLPNISCVVRGKKVYDPRTTLTAWSDNAALCLRDYLADAKRGFGAVASEINDVSFIAAANICDERVTFAGRSDTFALQSWSPAKPIVEINTSGPLIFLTNTIYRYFITFVKGSGETTAGSISEGVGKTTIGVANNTTVKSIKLSSIAVGPVGTTGRRIYRKTYDNNNGGRGGGGEIYIDTRFVGTLNDNASTEFEDLTGHSGGVVSNPPSISTYNQSDEATLTNGTYLATGDACTVSSTGSLPPGLTPATTYYWIRHTPYQGAFASTLANAMANIPINITGIGTGTHTLSVVSEARYRCNGTYDLNQQKKDVLLQLLSATGGTCPYVGGKFSLNVAAWRSPTATLTIDDLDGPISVVTRLSRRDVFNGVKGVYSNPSNLWQPTDFPAVTNAMYLAEDNNERNWLDKDFPFTTSYAAVQRLAKIDLEQIRQQISTVWPCKLSALVHQVGDVVRLTNARFGWSAKEFEITDLKMVSRSGADGTKRIGVDLALRETTATVYDWDSGEETIVDPAPNTNLPSGTVVEDLILQPLQSGTDQLYSRQDGTIFTRLKVSWTAAVGGYITAGGNVDVQYRIANTIDWITTDTVAGTETYVYILDVQDGQIYDVRARFRNSIGVAGNWATTFGYLVIGKTTPPANVTGFTASQNGNVAVMRWDGVADIDLNGYEIRYGRAGILWADGTPLSLAEGGTQVTTGAVPPGSWVLMIKAVDTSRNYSLIEARISIMMRAEQDIILQSQQSPSWPGIISTVVGPLAPGDGSAILLEDGFYLKTEDDGYSLLENPGGQLLLEDGSYLLTEDAYRLVLDDPASVECATFVRHWTGVLLPNSTKLAREMTNTELFEKFIPYPQPLSLYEAPEFDQSFDDTSRIWAGIESDLGPVGTGGSLLLEDGFKLLLEDGFSLLLESMQASGIADPQLWVDYQADSIGILLLEDPSNFALLLENGNRLQLESYTTAPAAYDGAELWTIGDRTARYYKAQVRNDASVGVARITGFLPTIDQLNRTENYTGLSISAAGTSIVFEQQFHRVPNVIATVVGGSALFPVLSNITTLGCVCNVYNTANSSVGGIVNLTATGV